MTTYTNRQIMRTYRQQRADKVADLARRRRNRLYALAALIVIAGVIIVQLWR